MLLASRFPVVVARATDEERLLDIIAHEAAAIETPLWVWTVTAGLRRHGGEPQYGTTEPEAALQAVSSTQAPAVYVFADCAKLLADPKGVRRIKEIARETWLGRTIVLAGSDIEIPADLRGLALTWTLRPPSRDELQALVGRTLGDLEKRNFPIQLSASERTDLVEAVRGLSVLEAEHVIQRAALRDGVVSKEDIAYVRTAKAQLVGADGTLELIEADIGGMDDIGGLGRLKEWLRVRRRAFEPQAAEWGLEPPRGVLLTGVPGCGKSLIAKTLARAWEMPLVLLDPARLYGRYVGESEQRLADALHMIEAMIPVVVWIDEVEKGFASHDLDGGTSQRVLGTFLRWMQERPAGAFIVATSNDVARLPPEFLRKGRFDEVFFVDLPEAAEREAIFSSVLARRGYDPAAFRVRTLATAAKGFSGAEIEAAVVGALYRAYADDADPTAAMIKAELKATVPLSLARPEQIDRIRAWASEHAVPA